MPYVANKNMNLAGKIYAKGDLIPPGVIEDIPAHRQGALTRTRLIIEVEAVEKPSGDMCPHCEEGPFQRLAQHVTLKHDDILLAEDQEEPPVGEDEESPTEEEE